MSPGRRTFYLTTPIYYVNATPHLGHAYTTIVADAMARYRRLAGDDVWFLTGTDEHGDNIAQAAAQASVSPQAYADRISSAFREAWLGLGITNDDFIRTTEARHKTVVQAILRTLWDRGEIYLGTYGGQYCFGCERFYTEKENADGKCPDHQRPLTYIEEENYFFKMSKYQRWLTEHIEGHPEMIRPERYRNEILGFLRDPLQDLSISRPRTRLEWGIPLPFDDKYVTYVWFDALINYVSALGGPGDTRFETYWPHAQHLIGKDILKPHAVYWPCMLQAAGLPVYTRLHVHGYWTVGGQKMSKSLGNVVEPRAFIEGYGRVGNDAFRYFIMREMTFGLDADFSKDAFLGRFNADLANDLGNFVSRASTMIQNFGDGVIPTPRPAPGGPGPGEEWEFALPAALLKAKDEIAAAMDDFAFQKALAAIGEYIARLNQYVDAMHPWTLAKDTDPAARERLTGVLYMLGASLRCLGILLTPFLPDASARILAAVGETGKLGLSEARYDRLSPGGRVQKVSGLFPRLEPPTRGDARPEEGVTGKPGSRITIDEFGKVELRVAEVLAAEPVPKSKKLLKLTVSLGTEQRTVVAGIAEHYAPADLVGKRVVVVANLEPARLMGVASDGMVLAGSSGERLAVVVLDRDLPSGARVT
ncbi:MAG: methionine--tRNA ligase [Candidatus Rokubacteria bacterium]|nr:methionine--tRNA ligase [Candidatus Rokubacteria bacterium]